MIEGKSIALHTEVEMETKGEEIVGKLISTSNNTISFAAPNKIDMENGTQPLDGDSKEDT